MFQNLFATGWAMHVVDAVARVEAPKENPTLCSPLNSSPTKSILSLKSLVRVQLNQLIAHAGIDWVFALNKKHQT